MLRFLSQYFISELISRYVPRFDGRGFGIMPVGQLLTGKVVGEERERTHAILKPRQKLNGGHCGANRYKHATFLNMSFACPVEEADYAVKLTKENIFLHEERTYMTWSWLSL